MSNKKELKEWSDLEAWQGAMDQAIKNYKRQEPRIFVSYGGYMHRAYLKAEREAYRQTTRYKLYKVKQAFRVLVKICFREWFKIRL